MTSVKGRRLRGHVWNELVLVPWEMGKGIGFERRHVYAICHE